MNVLMQGDAPKIHQVGQSRGKSQGNVTQAMGIPPSTKTNVLDHCGWGRDMGSTSPKGAGERNRFRDSSRRFTPGDVAPCAGRLRWRRF